MGIFDIIELKQHNTALFEYIVYLSTLSARDCIACSKELEQTLNYMNEHLKKSQQILDKLDK